MRQNWRRKKFLRPLHQTLGSESQADSWKRETIQKKMDLNFKTHPVWRTTPREDTETNLSCPTDRTPRNTSPQETSLSRKEVLSRSFPLIQYTNISPELSVGNSSSLYQTIWALGNRSVRGNWSWNAISARDSVTKERTASTWCLTGNSPTRKSGVSGVPKSDTKTASLEDG